jgi:GAF domain-containing protein
MPIEPAQLARSLGALGALNLEGGLARALQQVLRSARTLLDADRAGLKLLGQAGDLRWAAGSDRLVEAGPGDLSVPVLLGGGPVGTLDLYDPGPREWDDGDVAALQAYAGLVASVLAAAVTPGGTGRLTDQLQGALAHRPPSEQAVPPSDGRAQARAARREATDLEVEGHRRDSELHEGAARQYERRGQAGRAQTERLQAAAARGRIIDAKAEQRRADRQP